ncbi:MULTISPECIES: type IVa pilus pseudopilin TppD [Aeromonas]|uniref:type IVa pilus pseudopilin TppD n=1 Tax=Aeromonas TaxID=642 RepID=UPI000A075CD3|nr:MULTISPECIES: type IVa pilus pseudopilin TppD [Aeromonas]MCF5851091.1 type IVa pilus pseudopilin TppD [Aeromonas veronii]
MRLVKKNQGVALIVALVILVPLTLIAVVVMQSSGMSLKMAGSSASLQRAEHEVEGALESALSDTSLSTQIATQAIGTSAAIGTTTPTTLTVNTESVCKRKFEASSQNVTPACRYAEATTSSAYGKVNSQMTFTAGVEQPLLSAN